MELTKDGKKLTLYVTPDQHEFLRLLAYERNCSLAEVVRQLIEEKQQERKK